MESKDKQVAKRQGDGVAQKTGPELLVVDTTNKLPQGIEDYKASNFDLMSDYWTPEEKGESKRLIFMEVRPRTVRDFNSDKEIELEAAYFLEFVEGRWQTTSNGSKRLVSAIENRGIQQGQGLLVTYLGKVKNKTNSFLSDNWSVKPLIRK